jgi:uracil-DNA glycosylase family 4
MPNAECQTPKGSALVNSRLSPVQTFSALGIGHSALTPSLFSVREAIVACDACPRLRSYCQKVAADKKPAHRAEVYWGRPVPGFGDPNARVLVLGLAPAAHGANRTGRVFTGDAPGGSGDFLMRAMHRHGFASIPTSRQPDDGLRLIDAWIAAVVRCAPPENKPTPEEIARCRTHLDAELAALPGIQVVVALGRIAYEAYWRWLAGREVIIRPRPIFAHGAVYRPPGAPAVVCSYHPSRQNTNTGKLTPRMMASVFRTARRTLA